MMIAHQALCTPNARKCDSATGLDVTEPRLIKSQHGFVQLTFSFSFWILEIYVQQVNQY